MQANSPLITSPSFNSYSSAQLADIAARVVREFSNDQSQDDHDFNLFFPRQLPEDDDNGEEENDFEFAVVCTGSGKSPIAITPRYPLFNTALLSDRDELSSKSASSTTAAGSNTSGSKPIRLPLGKLFQQETTTPQKADGDELESLPAETYCAWAPNSRKKKSSTGSSKRWKLRDLLYV